MLLEPAVHGMGAPKADLSSSLLQVSFVVILLPIIIQDNRLLSDYWRIHPPNLSYTHESIQIASHRLNSTPWMARCP